MNETVEAANIAQNVPDIMKKGFDEFVTPIAAKISPEVLELLAAAWIHGFATCGEIEAAKER
jgi:hypothetical protein